MVNKFAKSRESLNWSAEAYKQAVREYMEGLGYTETLDSAVEGTQVDMVFEPSWSGTSRRVWVETKNAEVSVTDPQFFSELVGYCVGWLRSSREARPEIKVFVRKATNEKKWTDLLGPKFDAKKSRKWFEEMCSRLAVEQRPFLDSRIEEVLEFLGGVDVNEVTVEGLHAAAVKKSQTSQASLVRASEKLRADMVARIEQANSPQELIGNLVPIRPPKFLAIFEATGEDDPVVAQYLRESGYPPHVRLDRERILTLAPSSIKHAQIEEIEGRETRLAFEDARRKYPDDVIELLNYCVRNRITAKGARASRDMFFFPLVQTEHGHAARTIPSSTGRQVQVAVPKYETQILEEFGGQVSSLNYGFHRGFTAFVHEFAGECFVAIRTHRVYTDDGQKRMRPDRARKLDTFFRAARMNRAPTHLSVLLALEWYLFQDLGSSSSLATWHSEIRFNRLLALGMTKPVTDEEADQFTLDMFEPELEREVDEDEV